MGLFDYVKCEYPLPDGKQGEQFQSKDTPAQYMEHYTITSEGRLIHHKVHYEERPEEERPYYGTPEWEKDDFYKLAGIIKSVPVTNVDLEYHGDLYFDGYVARFTDGQLQWIKETS